MSARRWTLAIACLAATSWPSSARAADGDLEELLSQSVVTTASDTAETDRDAPATSTVITGESLRKYGAETLGDALSLLSLGTIAGTGGAGGIGDMGARGVTISNSHWEHFLLLINGARANGPFYGEADFGPAAVPLEIVDHIEVILGPGSVLYGSNAMLGVINVVTKEAKDFAGFRLGVESGLFTSMRPWVGYGGKFEIAGVHGEVTAQVEYLRQWGPKLYFDPVYGGVDPATGRPYRYTTAAVGTGVWGGAESASLTTEDSASLVSRVRLGKLELTINGQLSRAPVRVAVASFDAGAEDTSRRLLVNLGYQNQLSPLFAVKTHAYLNAADGLTVVTSSWAPTCPIPGLNCRNEILAQGVLTGIEAAPSFDWLKNGTLVTVVGAEGSFRSTRSIFNEYDAATHEPITVSNGIFNHDDVAVGAYVQQTWNPVKSLGLNAGGRLDDDPRFAPVFSPRLAARVDAWLGGTLKAIYSEAFRAPSFFESYFFHPLNPPPQGLRPERVRSIEGSVEQRFDAQRILFGAFATEWTDLIAYYNFTPQAAQEYVAQGKSLLPPLYQYRNLSSVHNWGFNAAFEGAQAGGTLQYGVNVTATMTRQLDADGNTTPLTVSPRFFGNARVSYRLPGELPTLALAFSAQAERAVENAFTSGFPSTPFVPAQLLVHATVTGEVPGLKMLSYRLMGFYSTTDREPYLAGPAVPASGRNTTPSLVPIDRARITVGLEYRFSP